jgi:hypothetical protein
MKKFLLTLCVSVLSACGGGVGGSASAPVLAPMPVVTSIGGTAATGMAIASGTVTVKCQSGNGTAQTASDGLYSVAITDAKLPCLLEIANPADGSRLHSVVVGSGTSVTANITPLTEMVTARLLGKDPKVAFTSFDAVDLASKATPAALAAAQADVRMAFAKIADTAVVTDLISTALKAATPSNPTGGDAQDQLLDALNAKLKAAQMVDIAIALTGTATPADIQTLVADFARPPPVAKAISKDGSAIQVGKQVILDGSQSQSSSNAPLLYSWTLSTKPLGSASAIDNPASVNPQFIPDAGGTYVAMLTVKDGSKSASFSVTMNAVNNTASITITRLPGSDLRTEPYMCPGPVLVLPPNKKWPLSSAVVDMAGAALQVPVQWTSSNPEVIQVDQNGNLLAGSGVGTTGQDIVDIVAQFGDVKSVALKATTNVNITCKAPGI